MVHTRASDNVVLDVPEGSAVCKHGCGHPPCGNASPPPPRPPVSLEQLLATQNELMTLLMQNEARRGGRRFTAPPTLGHEHVLLRVPGDSLATLLGGKGPARGR
jgi:hypothetical protein